MSITTDDGKLVATLTGDCKKFSMEKLLDLTLPDGVLTLKTDVPGYKPCVNKVVFAAKLFCEVGVCSDGSKREFLDPRKGGKVLKPGQMRVVLSWSDKPKDLDLH